MAGSSVEFVKSSNLLWIEKESSMVRGYKIFDARAPRYVVSENVARPAGVVMQHGGRARVRH